MFKELELSETDSVLAAYNAVCELVEDTERLQAACAAKEAELAELRGQTAELFGARLEAEGIGEEAVTAAKAMWQRDPQSVAMATLGCDFAEAANLYGHGFKEPHSGYGSGVFFHGCLYKNPAKVNDLCGIHAVFRRLLSSGESGIRTHGDISATLDFESSALDQLSHLSMKWWWRDYEVEEGRCQALFIVC